MTFVRRLLTVSVLFVAPLLQGQNCNWTPQPGQIVEDCGTVGVGTLSPWGGLHVKGAGQASANPQLTSTTQGQNGATLFLQDIGTNAGNGGMVVFGASSGHFAGLKGFVTDGSGNSTGHLLFLTRATTGDTTLTERIRIWGATGNVNIGTTLDNNARLRVMNTDPARVFNLDANTRPVITQSGNYANWATAGRNWTTVSAGATMDGIVGGEFLEAYNTGDGRATTAVGQQIGVGVWPNNGTVGTAYGSIVNIVGSVDVGVGVLVNDISAVTGYAFYQTGANDSNYFAGKVGIGTAAPAYPLHVVGNVRVDGTLTGTNVQAQYQDVAEWVPSAEDLEPGTLVVLDSAADNQVTRSTHSYDTAVAGVVSAQPGIVLGVGGASKEQIATTGRVRVRVDATAAPIRIGDLLVSSSRPGAAMKSQPIHIGGVAIHRPGTIIGKALEALPKGQGEILVLLSLQ